MSATIKIDTTDLNLALRDYIRATGQDSTAVVKKQSRLFAQQAMKRTPPKSYAQGRRAVAKDLDRIIDGAERGFMQRIIDWHGSADFVKQEFKRKDGSNFLVEWGHVRFDGSDLEEFHNANRDKRGRVLRAGDFTRNIGRWKANNKMIVPENVKRRYVRKVQKRVGRLKAGWIRPITRAGGNKMSVPAWIRQHNEGARSNAVLQGSGTAKVQMIMSNFASGASQLGNVVKSALRIRLSAMVREVRLIQSGYNRDFARNMRIRNRALRRR